MYETARLRDKLKLFLTIVIPILITQVSMYLMNVFDTLMSGRVGTEDLAGVAIGSSIWVPVFTGINGVLLAITPIVSHLLGAEEHKTVSDKVRQAIYIAIFLAIVIIIGALLLLSPVLELMDLDSQVSIIAKHYVLALLTGIIPLFLFNTIRSFIDALGQTRVSMFIILIALPLNIFFNYIFIFGKLGVPAFGGVGAGIATAITYWIICIIAVLIVSMMEPFRQYMIFGSWKNPILADWLEQFKIGVPIGFAIFIETSIFSAVTIFMSVYSTNTIAAHQAAMNFYSLLYMIPLSVGMALTITVGYEVGRKRFHDAKVYGRIGLFSGVLIAVVLGLVLLFASNDVAMLYNNNDKVIAMTSHFLLYAILLSFADCFVSPLH